MLQGQNLLLEPWKRAFHWGLKEDPINEDPRENPINEIPKDNPINQDPQKFQKPQWLSRHKKLCLAFW